MILTGGCGALKLSRTADHEVVEIVVRQEAAPGARIDLRGPVGTGRTWTVIASKPDPHGWKVTAVRCLSSCREHPGSGGGL